SGCGGGPPVKKWGKFWDHPIADGRALFAAAWPHVLTCRFAAPLMIERRSGLIVQLTEGDALYYRMNLFYDLGRQAEIRLAYGVAEELAPHGVTALALTPGFLRSEAMLDHFGVTEANWRDAVKKDRHFAHSETPCFVGRGGPRAPARAGGAGKAGGSPPAGAPAGGAALPPPGGRGPNFRPPLKGPPGGSPPGPPKAAGGGAAPPGGGGRKGGGAPAPP